MTTRPLLLSLLLATATLASCGRDSDCKPRSPAELDKKGCWNGAFSGRRDGLQHGQICVGGPVDCYGPWQSGGSMACVMSTEAGREAYGRCYRKAYDAARTEAQGPDCDAVWWFVHPDDDNDTSCEF